MIKHLITGGCSFSAGKDCSGWTARLTNKLKEINFDVTYEHTGYYSQGQDLIQKKVTLAILDALSAGIKNEDILVVVMYSGTVRRAWHIDNPDIINRMCKSWKNFQGGMSSQFLDLKNINHDKQKNYFQTSNGTNFDYDSNGGWYFTVDGSDCQLDFVKDYYLFDKNVPGIGKIIYSLENMIMLQTFCKLHNIKIVQQFFMDRTIQDIENNKDHESISYLYDNLDQTTLIKNAMFEYLHELLGISRDKAIIVPHHERIELDANRQYFLKDGFHPGEYGAKLYAENILFPFLLEKEYI